MKSSLAPVLLGALGSVNVAQAGDHEDVMAVIDRYVEFEESGNMLAQGDLMTDDRAMVYVGGRLTGDNRKVMREQQDYQDKFATEFPGVHYQIEIKDMRLQTWGGATALATFDWYPTRVVPATLPAAQAAKLEPAKTPLIVAMVLVKQAGAWKIAFTTFVPQQEPGP